MLLGPKDDIEEIRARPFDRGVIHSPEVRYRNALIRRLGEQQQTERRVRRLRITLQLPKCWRRVTGFPLNELGETLYDLRPRKPRASARPLQQLRVNVDARDHAVILP